MVLFTNMGTTIVVSHADEVEIGPPSTLHCLLISTSPISKLSDVVRPM